MFISSLSTPVENLRLAYKLQHFIVKWDLTAYLYLYTIHLASTALFILDLFIRCLDKQTNILHDINCVTVTSASTITKLDWKQPSVSRGRSLPFYRLAPCLIFAMLEAVVLYWVVASEFRLIAFSIIWLLARPWVPVTFCFPSSEEKFHSKLSLST